MTKRRTYTKEFNIEAVELADKIDNSAHAASGASASATRKRQTLPDAAQKRSTSVPEPTLHGRG